MTELTEAAASALDAAADWLERRGWIQHAFHGGWRSCALGALDASNNGTAIEIRIAAVRLLAEHICTECGATPAWPAAHLVAGWNDQPGRTADDVITAMRKTALTAREQA